MKQYVKKYFVLQYWPYWGIIFILLLALLGDQLGYSPSEIDVEHPLQAVTFNHLFGTDELGRDLLARLSLGAKVSLSVGFFSAIVSVIIGALYGATSALLGKHYDAVLMRIVDVLYSLPFLMVVVLFSLILNQSLSQITFIQGISSGANLIALVVALAFFSWPDTARMVRGQVLKLKQESFIEAAKSLGGNQSRILLHHLIPNLMPLILLNITITLPRAILTEATLSFIGLGINPPWCSWGTMIGDGWQMIRIAPHLLIMPALLLVVTVLSFNACAKTLRTLSIVKN